MKAHERSSWEGAPLAKDREATLRGAIGAVYGLSGVESPRQLPTADDFDLIHKATLAAGRASALLRKVDDYVAPVRHQLLADLGTFMRVFIRPRMQSFKWSFR